MRWVKAGIARKQFAELLHSRSVFKTAIGVARPWIARIVCEWGEMDFRRSMLALSMPLLPNQAFPRLRALIMRALGIRLGERTLIRGKLKLTGPPGCVSRLTIGRDCYFTTPLHIDLNSDVVIGDGVVIGPDVLLLTAGHHIGGPARRCAAPLDEPVRIGDGCWLGARVVIMPGVVLGAGSVIAAGAVVTRDVEPNTVVGGVPARVISRLDEPEVHKLVANF